MRGGALRASSVLARSNGDIAVIDTGMGHHAASLVAALKAEGVAPAEVTLVFNTHAHVDHSHNNSLFPNARVYASRRDRHWTREMHAVLAAARTPEPEDLLPFYPSMTSGAYNPRVVRKILAIEKLLWDESRWREDDRTIWLEDVQPPPGIRVIDTPGHGPHHVSFAIETDGRPMLVCGDALLHRDDLDGVAPLMLPWDVAAYHASHDTIRSFDGIIVPGHDEAFDNVPFGR
jgi:glyoxylase-like metal-dependent hydrolase (beta-lactamase superfamily II)